MFFFWLFWFFLKHNRKRKGNKHIEITNIKMDFFCAVFFFFMFLGAFLFFFQTTRKMGNSQHENAFFFFSFYTLVKGD